MKRLLSIFFLSFIIISSSFAVLDGNGPYYLALEFVKPSYDFIEVVSKTGNHISFGNPQNNGKDNPIVKTFDINYRLQSPGTIFVFFSSENDLGEEKGDLSNNWMLYAQGGKNGLNYGVSITATTDWEMPEGQPKTASFAPPFINIPLNEITDPETDPPVLMSQPIYVDVGSIVADSRLNTGVVVRHGFTREDINLGIEKNSKLAADDVRRGFATGTDEVTLTIEPAKTQNGVKLKSGLYYGYIVVHFSAL